MSIFVDVNYGSLNKHNEELCGDKVEIIRNKDSVIVVLADGLGSGVKANILATLTSKIIATMLSKGANIDEAVDTVINTLPVCKVRNLAYSTFTILQIQNDGYCYLVEFDNPSVIRLRMGKFLEINKTEREIDGKKIKESRFKINQEDVIVMVSDGAIHAGVGQCLNLGWQWVNLKDYIEKVYEKGMNAKAVSAVILSVCDSLYASKPGDDTTVVAVKIRNAVKATILIGPPVDKNMDKLVVKKLMSESGIKVVCGGTTSQIVSRITGQPIEASLNYVDPSIPPIGKINGIDLTTEGVLTMCKALEYVREYNSKLNSIEEFKNFNKEDGASRLAKVLIEDSTEVQFLVGRAINPAHQNPDFPLDFGVKLKLVKEIEECLKQLGKKVNVEYF